MPIDAIGVLQIGSTIVGMIGGGIMMWSKMAGRIEAMRDSTMAEVRRNKEKCDAKVQLLEDRINGVALDAANFKAHISSHYMPVKRATDMEERISTALDKLTAKMEAQALTAAHLDTTIATLTERLKSLENILDKHGG